MIQYLLDIIVSEILMDIRIINENLIELSQNILRKYKQNAKSQFYRKKLKQSVNVDEWIYYANKYDNLDNQIQWQNKKESVHYDYEYIEDQINKMKLAKKDDKIFELIDILRSHCFRNIGGINDHRLYLKCYNHTKTLIQKYINEFKQSLQYVYEYENQDKFPNYMKYDFFSSSKHSFGRTALLLSGGGYFGSYHFGFIKQLYNKQQLPKIFSGSSAGSIIASFVCTQKYEDLGQYLNFNKNFNYNAVENQKAISFQSFIDYFKNINILNLSSVQEFLRQNIGDITFKEAYEKTGFILNISVTGLEYHDRHRLLNYLTSPDVLIWSASAASCGIPKIYGSAILYMKDDKGNIQEWLYGRKFIDGSIDCDLPKQRVAQLFNVTCFLVSQVNPHVLLWHQKEKRHQKLYKKFINHFITNFFNIIKKEIKNKIQFLFLIFNLPYKFKRIFSLLSQKYSGDVTVYPDPSINDYLSLLLIPNLEQTQMLAKQMEVLVQPKISNLLEIEFEIEKYHFFLKQKKENLISQYKELRENRKSHNKLKNIYSLNSVNKH